jgi:hypothetical protein
MAAAAGEAPSEPTRPPRRATWRGDTEDLANALWMGGLRGQKGVTYSKGLAEPRNEQALLAHLPLLRALRFLEDTLLFKAPRCRARVAAPVRDGL